ncbi:MAG: type II toxin-antitoxin system Phd/YefM family antitoxin [Anaerolineales bacterium]|jgi:antitoxin Phd|uniref:type II toxin-antitoxin system Phd/YefM family antitoxin n=1 Tax=Candidatus Villigracilis vicinus TaxID=3140679 RepID=UPI003135A3BB|nr:type II toxin-antitoxin system Phd/YefM family antitoxin [Anaerolineales bacterium]MBK7449566.1 type II toxin-antitoxin system Phd/YefM family antitoxin [Anaerolineales bacterium]MBK9779199.1 type II toxin-antitoxin system Phd/YefM family antitoxin [Anaerolineales bacterium]
MIAVWQIQDAKNKLSEVITRALMQGPQVITKHGEKAVVVISYTDYEKLRKSQGKLSEFFSTSPLAGMDLDLKRNRSLPRKNIHL